MAKYTDHIRHPDHGPNSIQNTTGVWLRTLKTSNTLELWINGRIYAAWTSLTISSEIALDIARICYEQGIIKGGDDKLTDLRKFLKVEN